MSLMQQHKEQLSKQSADEMNRVLAKAARDGDAELVRCYVAKGCDPRAKLKDGFKPPLYWACRYGHVELARELIEKYQCSPKYVTERGTTLLYLVCTMGHVTLARYLAKTHLLDPNVRVKGASMLHAACSNGHLQVVRFLVAEMCCDPRADDNLLHTACARGHLEIAKYFIEELHFDAGQSAAFGQTPLLAATSNGHLSVARYLIEVCGCSVACTDDAGSTPLHVACQNKHLDVISYLLQLQQCDPSQRDKSGSTPIHLACRYGRLEVVKLLLETGRVDPSATNHLGEAPIQIAHDKDIIRELIRGGAKTKGMELTPEQLLLHSGDKYQQSLVRMFVVGHPSTGKSTLVKALQMGGKKHAPGFARRAKVTGVPTRTAGIIPTEFDSPEFGRVLMFDFAGQYEYYASHATLLESSGDGMPPLFMVVVDLSKGDEEAHHLIHYWTTFLESHRSATASKPHLIIIGSHKDILKKDSTYKLKISATEQFVRKEIEHSSFHLAGFFAIDCREPTKHHKLRHCMRQSCHSLRSNVEVDITCQVLSIYLLDEFRDQMTCQVKDVIHRARKSNLAIPLTTHRLCELCEALSNRMSILFLKNSHDLGKSWIVLDIETLLSKINGRIFAPKGFTERCFEASNTGILSYTDIWKTFEDLDPSLVVAFLNRLEFCQPVSDPEVLRLIRDGRTPLIFSTASGSSSDSEEYDGPSSNLSTNSHKCISAPNLLDMNHDLSHYVERDNPDPPVSNSLSPPKPRLIYHPSGITPPTEQPNLSYSCNTLATEVPNSFLFFPALIGVESPSNSVWQLSEESQFTYHTGWCLQCSQQNNFFTPRLLQILLLRMAFGFAVGKTSKNGFMPDPYMFQRECTLWKNGVRWMNLDGIEAVVEMIDNCRTILCLMRGMKGSRMKFIQLRAQVIHKILEAKEEFCSNVVTQESLIDMSCLKQPYELVKRDFCNQRVRLYDVVLVARSIVEKRQYVYDRAGQHLRQLEELLDFEPYANLGEELLGELFDAEEKVDEQLLEFLYRFSQCNNDRASLFAEVLNISLSRRITPNHSPRSSFSMVNGAASFSPSSSLSPQFMGQNPCMDVLNHWWEKGSVSLVDFRRQMDNYSLFSGRNILSLLYRGVTTSIGLTL